MREKNEAAANAHRSREIKGRCLRSRSERGREKRQREKARRGERRRRVSEPAAGEGTEVGRA